MKHRLLYNQRARPLVVRRDNAALTHEAQTSIQPEGSPPGGQERERSVNTWSIDFYTTRGVAPLWSGERTQQSHMKHRLLYNQRNRPLVVRRENAAYKTLLGLDSSEPEVSAVVVVICAFSSRNINICSLGLLGRAVHAEATGEKCQSLKVQQRWASQRLHPQETLDQKSHARLKPMIIVAMTF